MECFPSLVVALLIFKEVKLKLQDFKMIIETPHGLLCLVAWYCCTVKYSDNSFLGFSYVQFTLPYPLNTMIWTNGRVMLAQSVSGNFYPVEPLSCLHSARGPLWDCDRKPADRYKS